VADQALQAAFVLFVLRWLVFPNLVQHILHRLTRQGHVLVGLQTHPEFVAVAKKFGQAQGGVYGDGAFFTHDVVDAWGGYLQRHGQRMRRELAGPQKLFP